MTLSDGIMLLFLIAVVCGALFGLFYWDRQRKYAKGAEKILWNKGFRLGTLQLLHQQTELLKQIDDKLAKLVEKADR